MVSCCVVTSKPAVAGDADAKPLPVGPIPGAREVHTRDARGRLEEGAKAYPDQQVFTHGLARLLAAAPDDRLRDGPRAMELVQELVARGRTLDLGATMAMALAELGRFAEAAALQRDLIAAADKNGLRDVVRRLKTNLGLYERSEPCRTPWADGELQ